MSDSESGTPPISAQALTASENLIPPKSRENKVKSFSESMLLAYFNNLKQNLKPLVLLFNVDDHTNCQANIHTEYYQKLQSFLKYQMASKAKNSRGN